MPDAFEVWYCPLDQWLVALAEGWWLPWVVSPMEGHHGCYAVLLSREVPPNPSPFRL